VLRLPAESPKAIAAVTLPLDIPPNAEPLFVTRFLAPVGANLRVRNLLNQPCAKDGRRDTEAEICGVGEVLLADGTLPRIASIIPAPTDDVQGMHLPIKCGSDFPDRALAGDKSRHFIVSTTRCGEVHLRIHGRGCSSYSRMGMAASAAIQVEARAKAITNPFGAREFLEPKVK
jgi:hypothetical protein